MEITTISSDDLKKLIGIASKDGTSYHLQGIRFWGGKMFTTDDRGMTFVELPDLKDELDSYMIDTDTVKALPKGKYFNISLSEKTIYNNNFTFKLIEVKPINLDALIPTRKPRIAVDDNGVPLDKDLSDTINRTAFNPELLLKTVKAHPDYTKRTGIKIEFTDALSPICIYLKNGGKPYLAGVVMPMRF